MAAAEPSEPRVTGVRATVSGSFRRHLGEVANVIAALSAGGAEVLSPRSTTPAGQEDDFVLLEGDEGTPAYLESAHLAAIDQSDLLYVVDPDGYVGASVSVEIGYALGRGVPIFASERPRDGVFAPLVQVAAPREAIEAVRGAHNAVPPLGLALPALQRWLALTARRRGFGDETVSDLLLLLTEETGELARAVRVHEGVARAEPGDAAASELADCLIYLFLLANALEIDAERALLDKEGRNAGKYPLLSPRREPAGGE